MTFRSGLLLADLVLVVGVRFPTLRIGTLAVWEDQNELAWFRRSCLS
jgi:hypothetical protein